MTRASFLSVAMLFACAPLALPQPNPPAEQPAGQSQRPPVVAPEPPLKPKLILRELLVVQADRYDEIANNPKLHATTLPAKIIKKGRDKRTDPSMQYEYKPIPLGIITFQGVIHDPLELRINLESSNSRIQAHWPTDAQVGPQLAIWKSIHAAGDQKKVHAFSAGQGDWLSALRDSDDRLWLGFREDWSKERFLLYDASFKFTPAMELLFSDGQYSLKSRAPEQADPPLCVLIRNGDAGWTADTLAAPWPTNNPSIGQRKSDNPPSPSLGTALASLKELLTSRGYNKQEIRLAVGMIAAAGVDGSRLSLVYVLPVGIVDEHVSLRVKPKPDEVIRTAIVVVNNVDPDLGSRVKALLDDLGSDQWLKRDRAQRELTALGQAAIKKVQPLKNSKDPEVAFRVRQILDAYDLKMGGSK